MTDNAKTIWGYLMGKIGNAKGVAALMGNLYAESLLNPRNLQNSYESSLGMSDEEYTKRVDDGTYDGFVTDAAGYGLAQWTYSTRKAGLLNLAWARKKSVGDLDVQLDYLWQELQGYARVLDALLTAETVRAASDVVLTQYERPKDQSEAMKARRAAFGEDYLARFGAAAETAGFRATGEGLAAFAEAVFTAGWVYWYGTCGYACTKALLDSKAKQYPKHYMEARAARYRQDIEAGRMCADCVGLIKAYFWLSGDLDGKNVYKANDCPDKSADGMFALCEEHWPIDSIPDRPGLVVHKSGHIGVYVGGGYTVEMMGFAYGCRRRRVKAGSWTEWGRLPESMISYGASGGGGAVPANPATEPLFAYPGLLKRGSRGEAVKKLQSALNRAGFACGAADGDFGPKTEAAVKALQQAAGITVDGEFGPVTYDALKKRWR